MDGSLDLFVALIRAASFVAALGAAGLALFLAFYEKSLPDRHVTSSHARICRDGVACAVTAVITVVLTQCLQAARMNGAFAGMFDPGMQRYSWSTSAGWAAGERTIGALLLWWSFARSTRAPGAIAIFGAMIVVLSFPATGHTSQAPSWSLQTLLEFHILAVAFWFGALPALLRVLANEERSRATAIIGMFSKHATVVFPVLGAVGLALAWYLIPDLSVFQQPYGYLLLAKIAGYSALLCIAAWNKLRLTRQMEEGAVNAVPALQRSIKVEIALAIAVLTATAFMTSFYSPQSGGE
jgi:copper resistance protein D